ncbi:hypothetical protein F4803DRAFT_165941 [Xylaria telfairii]|nr:hypothetical protein F4803DRAFT_165941 [Xylaria telfairii]
MADPLSIASGALAVIGATQKTASVIYKFIRDCKEARTDLAQVTGELSELTLILELIRDDNAAATQDCLPSPLQAQVQAMLTSSATTVQQIENILAKCRGKPGPLRWTIIEKDKVTTLKASLEAFKSALNLALETINLSRTREIKNKTEIIQDNTAEIKRDTSEILDEIYKLRNQLPPNSQSDQERVRLEQWLDSLTHYAETVVANDEAEEFLDPASFDTIGEERSAAETSHPTNAQEQEASNHQVFNQPSAEEQTQHKRGPYEIPHHLIASMPCSSRYVTAKYCAALDIWAVLHEDLVLRFWSPDKAELIATLLLGHMNYFLPDADTDTFKQDTHLVRLQFCPIKPELILIQVWRRRLEVWDWRKNRRISIASGALKTFIETAVHWVKFIPLSTLIYAPENNDLMIVDLDAPLVSQKTSFEMLMGRDGRVIGISKNGSPYTHVNFVSKREIWIMWKSPFVRQSSLFWRTKSQSPWSALVVKLKPPALLSDLPTVTDMYSDAVMKSARVTAKYQLQQGIQSITHADSDHKTRRVLLSANLDDGDRRGRGSSMGYILDLDTGTQLFQFPIHKESKKYRHFWYYPAPYRYFFSYSPSTSSTRLVSVESGRELGMLEWQGRTTSSGKLALMRQVASGLQFGITDISLIEFENSQK